MYVVLPSATLWNILCSSSSLIFIFLYFALNNICQNFSLKSNHSSQTYIGW